MLLHLGVDIVWCVGLRDLCNGLGPGEGRAFAVGEEGSLAPGFEGVQALLGFAGGAGVEGMHVEAVGATVDLRGTHFDEMEELWLEPALGDVLFNGEQVLERLLSVFAVIDARLYGFLLR